MYKRNILLLLVYFVIWGGDAETKASLSQRRYALQEHESFYNLTLYSNGKFEYNYTLFRYGKEFTEVGAWKKVEDTVFLKDKINTLLTESRTDNEEVVLLLKDRDGQAIQDIQVSINGNEYITPNKKGEVKLKKKDISYANISKRKTYLIQYYRKSGNYPIESIALKNETESIKLSVKDILSNYFVVTVSEGLNYYQPRTRKLAIHKNSLFFYDYTPLKKNKIAKFLFSEN